MNILIIDVIFEWRLWLISWLYLDTYVTFLFLFSEVPRALWLASPAVFGVLFIFIVILIIFGCTCCRQNKGFQVSLPYSNRTRRKYSRKLGRYILCVRATVVILEITGDMVQRMVGQNIYQKVAVPYPCNNNNRLLCRTSYLRCKVKSIYYFYIRVIIIDENPMTRKKSPYVITFLTVIFCGLLKDWGKVCSGKSLPLKNSMSFSSTVFDRSPLLSLNILCISSYHILMET